MKRLLHIILLVCLLPYNLFGCARYYDVDEIRVYHYSSDWEWQTTISGEEADTVCSIINGIWELDQTKNAADYIFELPNGTVFHYSLSGIINDRNANKHLELSEKENEIMYSIFFKENTFSNSNSMKIFLDSSNAEFNISEEQKKDILTIINNTKWEVGSKSKLEYDIRIDFGEDRAIYYSSESYTFIDEGNDLHLWIVHDTPKKEILDSIIVPKF